MIYTCIHHAAVVGSTLLIDISFYIAPTTQNTQSTDMRENLKSLTASSKQMQIMKKIYVSNIYENSILITLNSTFNRFSVKTSEKNNSLVRCQNKNEDIMYNVVP